MFSIDNVLKIIEQEFAIKELKKSSTTYEGLPSTNYTQRLYRFLQVS